ncbi:hypothetical protein [Flaviaesturariibacter amylovorans]|uniref:hypothetical protein n=1 Tax=Flaviaesturariibacter amylovorans TaxID=1084520 RepID=UPI0031EFF735
MRSELRDAQEGRFSQEELNRFIKVVRKKERETLPIRRRRALEVSEYILNFQLKEEQSPKESEMETAVKETFKFFRPLGDEVSVDHESFSRYWLDLLMPYVRKLRERNGRKKKRYLSLNDLKAKKYQPRFHLSDLEFIKTHLPLIDPIDTQIAACIVSVPRNK